MSGIFGIIKRLCCDGVEFRRLGEVVRIKNGKDHKELNDGEFPVYGSGGVMRYVDSYIYNKPSVLIPRKGSLSNLFYVDVPFWNVDTIFYTEVDDTQLNPKFLYYFLSTVGLGNMNQAGGVPSQTQAVLKELKIAVPPLGVQLEIVKVLDAFIELEAELEAKLEAELEARRKQYEYYRDVLLAFDNRTDSKDGEFIDVTLGDVTITVASGRSKCRSIKGSYPVYGSTGLIGYTEKAPYSGDALLVARVGANAGLVNAVNGEYDVSDNTIIIRPNSEWNVRFAYHQLINMNLNQYAVGAGQPLITARLLRSLKLVLPSLEVQERIASILDEFDVLVSSLTEGLPQEIELRRKQYEYYRDKLLSFVPLEKTA